MSVLLHRWHPITVPRNFTERHPLFRKYIIIIQEYFQSFWLISKYFGNIVHFSTTMCFKYSGYIVVKYIVFPQFPPKHPHCIVTNGSLFCSLSWFSKKHWSILRVKAALWCFPQSLQMVISRYSSSLCTCVSTALARCQSQRSCQTPPPRWSRGFLCVLYYGAGAHTWRWVGSVVQLCSYTEVFAGRTTAVLFLHRRTVVLLLFCSLVCVMWDCTYVWWPLGLTFLSFRWMWNFFEFFKRDCIEAWTAASLHSLHH